MNNNQIISLLCGDVISYDEGGWACKFDKDAKEKIITALEKRTPAEPEEYAPIGYKCPDCGSYVWGFTKKQDFCSNCGQAIDWSEVE